MVKRRLALSIVATTLAASLANAQTGVLDQTSPIAAASIGLLPTGTVWQQQFHLGSAAYLEGVRLYFDGDAGAQVDVRLRAGAGWSASPTALSKRVTKAANGLESVFVSAAGAIAGPAGTTAVIEIAAVSGPVWTVGSYVAPPGTPLYPDALFVNGGPGCFGDCGWRIAFQSYLAVPPHVSSYCTAGTTTNNCVPALAGIGTPSAVGIGSFVIQASNVEGQKLGLIFYGTSGPNQIPWGPGSTSFMCVKAPVQRTPVQNSGGASGQCNGSLSVNWNAFIAAHPWPPVLPGTGVWAQAWFRDPQAVNTTNLSDALFFVP